MIPYILHVTVITTVCFLFYKLLLQKETFYRLNRWTLLTCLAVAFALPLLPVPREWSWRDKWVAVEGTMKTPERVGLPRETGAGLRATGDGLRETGAGLQATGDGRQETGAGRQATGDGRQATGGGLGETGAASAAKSGAASEQETVVAPMLQAMSFSQVKTKRHGHGSAAAAGRKQAAVERPATAVVSGIADAGDKSSQTTTGTPAEKKGAGTLARFFSGATLLLALQWLFYVYLFGVVLFGARFLLQLAVLLYQSYSRPVIKDGRFRIVEISGDRAPCSFGNTIFINPERYDWETYNQILIHEKIHVSGRHTLDILLAEVALVIQWFNPFAWLYRREVENNLEFLTDAHVLLDATIERSAYQLSLLRVSAPDLAFSLTNNYNQSLLKRRIVMMNSQSSSLHTVWKYFFLIPLLTGLMCALNKPAIALGAATTKLSRAHAPLFNLIAPVADTTKKPARSADTGSAAVGKPAKVKVPDEGFDDGDAYDRSMTISGAEPDPQAIAMTIDAYNQGMKKVSATEMRKNLSFTYSPGNIDIRPFDVKINAAIDAHALGKILIADMPRFGFVDDTVLTDGSWYATSYGDHLSFELKAGDEDHNWDYTLRIDKSEINPFPGSGNVSFKLVREAGTVEFKGQFDGEEGFGHFHFVPDAAYFPALRQMGVEDIEDRRQFGFFAMNIKKDYVSMLTHNGYPHITQRDLLSFAAMHIDEAYIQYWHGVNLGEGDGDVTDPRTLIRLKAMHIDRAYVDDLKAAGYDHLNLHELESLKAQHIDRAYIQSMGHGLNNQPIPVRELVSYKAMHIDSAYVQGLRKAGYDNLDLREISSLYAMHVTPEYIGQLQALGYKDLGARELTSLKAMGVTPDLVKGYQAAGYKDLTTRALTQLKATGVTPDFMKGFTELGYTELDARDLASLKAMGVTPDFVAGFQKLGFDHIPARLLTQLKASGVTPEYVGKMKAQGFESKDLSKYIRLKMDFN
jgi:hypothetical protein